MNIVILTPIQVEHDAVLTHLKNIDDIIKGGRHYVSGTFEGKFHSYNVITEQTGSTNPTISIAASSAITNFNPVIMLLVGIAGGVKDVDIGDVVVGTKSYGYEVGKETETGLLARPENYTGSKALEAVAKLVRRKKEWPQRSPFAKETTEVFFGPIAGGEKVIATSKGAIAAFLKQHYNDTLAIEMEAYGFGQALTYDQKINWLNIRGISDLLSGKSKSDSEGSQEKAAANAAAFAFELLHRLDGSDWGLPLKGGTNTASKKNEDNSDISEGLPAIRELLANDKIENALKALMSYSKDKDSDIYNDLISQSGRWNRLKREKRQGVITNNEAQILQNRISYSLLSIIEDLEDG